jgi:hypothetical protein
MISCPNGLTAYAIEQSTVLCEYKKAAMKYSVHYAHFSPPEAYTVFLAMISCTHSLWYGLVWFGLVWFSLVWFGLVWYSLHYLFQTVTRCAEFYMGV